MPYFVGSIKCFNQSDAFAALVLDDRSFQAKQNAIVTRFIATIDANETGNDFLGRGKKHFKCKKLKSIETYALLVAFAGPIKNNFQRGHRLIPPVID